MLVFTTILALLNAMSFLLRFVFAALALLTFAREKIAWLYDRSPPTSFHPSTNLPANTFVTSHPHRIPTIIITPPPDGDRTKPPREQRVKGLLGVLKRGKTSDPAKEKRKRIRRERLNGKVWVKGE
jgi:hypothetical protein